MVTQRSWTLLEKADRCFWLDRMYWKSIPKNLRAVQRFTAVERILLLLTESGVVYFLIWVRWLNLYNPFFPLCWPPCSLDNIRNYRFPGLQKPCGWIGSLCWCVVGNCRPSVGNHDFLKPPDSGWRCLGLFPHTYYRSYWAEQVNSGGSNSQFWFSRCSRSEKQKGLMSQKWSATTEKLPFICWRDWSAVSLKNHLVQTYLRLA
jgi:hypothetical protein